MGAITWLRNMIKFINKKTVSGYIYHMEKELVNEGEKLSVEAESQLFHNAKDSCVNDLFLVEEKTTGIVRDIVRVHRMFLEDPKVIEETLTLIKEGNSRGYSYTKVVDKYINYLKNNNDEYLIKRIDDFIDIKYRMLMRMYKQKIEQSFNKDTIVVVDQLLPSLVFNAPPKVVGIISKTGSALTHAAILAKEKGISYVVTNKRFKEDSLVILDSEQNRIIENPTKDLLKIAKESNIIHKLTQEDTFNTSGFHLYLNLSSSESIDKLVKNHIEGVGLFRTEHIVLGSEIYPTFETQVVIYKHLLKQMYPKKVKIRLFDFTGDKKLFFLNNEFIDSFQLFGILHHVYEEQLKALLFSNEGLGNLEVMIPMIRDDKEFSHVKDLIQTLKETHNLKGEVPNVGIMMETKEGFNQILKYKDVAFMSIGTNDLSYELFGISREKAIDYHHYAKLMIEPIKTISQFCRKHQIEYSICGDLASHEDALTKLIHAQEKHFSIPHAFLKQALTIIDLYNKQPEKR